MRSLTLLTILVVLPVQAIAASQMLPDRDVRLATACEVLLTADAVYDRFYGDAATSTKEYSAFETLWLEGEYALPYAKRLTRSGTPAARVYGILLLHEIDEASASDELPRLLEESTSIVVWSGCLGETLTVGAVARMVRDGEQVVMTPPGRRRPIVTTRSPQGLSN